MNFTDPAREIAELCQRLSQSAGIRGDDFLAGQIGVDVWSREFFMILFCISERIELLVKLIDQLDLDDDIRESAKSHAKTILSAFDRHSMTNGWDRIGYSRVGAVHAGPLMMLSSQIRAIAPLPKLDDDEVQEILAEAETLREWLEGHQAGEADFIRQAIIEGLNSFVFRLERLAWVGWGFPLESLREVITAYFALERMDLDPKDNPQADAILKKLSAFTRSIYDKVNVAKNVVETGDFMLRAYGAFALIAHQGSEVAGLIGDASG